MGLPVTVVRLVMAVQSAAAAPDSAGAPPVPEMGSSLLVRTRGTALGAFDGRTISETIRELRQLSPTFRDLLEVLAGSRVLMLVSPSTEVWTEHRQMGRTRFFVDERRIVALTDVYVDRPDLWRRREAIAHELAHVAEVVCLGDVTSVDDIYRLLPSYGGYRPSRQPDVVNETGFAEDAGRRVVREAASTKPGVSAFRALSLQHQLPSCPSRLAGDRPALAQKP